MLKHHLNHCRGTTFLNAPAFVFAAMIPATREHFAHKSTGDVVDWEWTYG